MRKPCELTFTFGESNDLLYWFQHFLLIFNFLRIEKKLHQNIICDDVEEN